MSLTHMFRYLLLCMEGFVGACGWLLSASFSLSKEFLSRSYLSLSRHSAWTVDAQAVTRLLCPFSSCLRFGARSGERSLSNFGSSFKLPGFECQSRSRAISGLAHFQLVGPELEVTRAHVIGSSQSRSSCWSCIVARPCQACALLESTFSTTYE